MHVLTKEEIRHDLVTWKHKFEQAQAELELLRNPWVSVEDSTPETDGEFIVRIGDDVTTKEFNPWISGDGENSHSWFEWQDVPNYGSEKCLVLGVTHWTPLPSTSTIKG